MLPTRRRPGSNSTTCDVRRVLGLSLTDEAASQLRALRLSHPSLYELVANRITQVRSDPGGRHAGRSFLLEDGRTARLITFYDARRGADLCLVWLLDSDEQGTLVKVVWAAPFDEVD